MRGLLRIWTGGLREFYSRDRLHLPPEHADCGHNRRMRRSLYQRSLD